MTRRLLGILVALAFLLTAGNVAAQFGPLKKKKEEKPAEKKEEKKEEPAATSTATSTEAMKTVNWTENGITFEVPGNWQQMVMQRDMALFSLLTGDSAGVSINISRYGNNFPADASLKANREDAAKKKQNKEYVSIEDYNIGKAKGVMWVEAEKAAPDDVRRLTWVGFQKKNGWNQVTVHLSSKSGAFSNYEAAFRKILATLKVESE